MAHPAKAALKDWLKRRGWTEGDLAEALQVTKMRVIQILDDDYAGAPSLQLAASIEAMTGILASSWVEPGRTRRR